MAIMIPGLPLDFDLFSKEDVIFNHLRDNLPPEVYVCHSLKVQFIEDNKMYTAEIDFLVLIPGEGVILIESKAGQIYPECQAGLSYMGKETGYLWHLANGEIMKYNGPFAQSERAMHTLEGYLKSSNVAKYDYASKICFARCVCLPTISDCTINSWTLPPDSGSRDLILSRDDVMGKNVYSKLLKVISTYKTRYGSKYVAMNKSDCENFINYVIAPTCNLIPSKNFWVDLQEKRINAFLNEQKIILDFMDEQRVAVIGGAAGTGKTMIAIEKARRLAEDGKKVLFLCYNVKLKDSLASQFAHDNIEYQSIDSLAYKYLHKFNNIDYSALKKCLEEDLFGKNINFIVDEAQDFGKSEIEKSGILKLLVDLTECTDDCCCYMFYDKYQCVQSHEIPSVVRNADCKMSLYKNCRNTVKIAETSYKVFKKEELHKRTVKGFEEGQQPYTIICNPDDSFDSVKKLVNFYRKRNYKDFAILTAKTIETSLLASYVKGEKIFFDSFPCKFATCRTFKGLEAEVIILVDLDKHILLDEEDRLLFYVGSSRAKFELGLVMNLTTDECSKVTNKYSKLPIQGKQGLVLYFGTKLM